MKKQEGVACTALKFESVCPYFNEKYWLAQINTLAEWCYPTVIGFCLENWAKWWPAEMNFKVARAKISKYLNFIWIPRLSNAMGWPSPLELNDVLAVLHIEKSNFLTLYYCGWNRTPLSCLAITEHYQWPDFRSQKHGSFCCIDCCRKS